MVNAKVKAGFHQTDITPPIGMESAGTYRKRYLTEVHDSLKARAAVFDDGENRVAMVGLDICIIPSGDFTQRVRREVQNRCGIAAGAVLLAASHTHSGPCTLGHDKTRLAHAPQFIKRLAFDLSPAIDPLYIEWLVGQTASAVVEADRRKEHVILSAGRGYEDQSAFNRRFRMRNGRVFTHPGKMNPDIIGPAGPVDPEVGVIGAWNMSGELLGCVVNFACHGTVMNGTAISADWIHYMVRAINGVMGEQAVPVFLNGACGDLTQIDNASPRPTESGERWAELLGTRVGAEVVKTLVTAERGEWKARKNSPTVAFACKMLKIPRRRLDKKRLRESLQKVKQGLKDEKLRSKTEWTFAKEYVIADYLADIQPVVPVEVQALQIGPVVVVANPSEFFCHLGLKIKEASAFPITFVVELANGNAGYTPGRDAFRPDGGGYETVLTSYSTLAVDAGDKITRASIGLISGFKPGVLPHTVIKAPGKPWGYGVLGPDA